MNDLVFVFDADGVVIGRNEWFSQRLARELGLREGEVLKFFATDFLPCLTGKADLKKQIAPWLKKWGWKDSVDNLLAFWFESENNPERAVVALAQALRDMRHSVYLATNQEEYRAHFMFEEMGFKSLFDHCFFSAEMHRQKPNKDFYAYVWESIAYLDGVERKSDVLFIDDEEKNVEQARAFGFNSHLYTDLDTLKKDLKHRYNVSV